MEIQSTEPVDFEEVVEGAEEIMGKEMVDIIHPSLYLIFHVVV